MAKLFIVGNGFDLAHGYKTSYADYFKYLLESSLTDKELHSHMFQVKLTEKFETVDNLISTYKNNPNGISFSNLILKSVYIDFINMNWSDIEEKYFELLKISSDQAEYLTKEFKSAIIVLNNQFNQIKSSFEEYLVGQVFPSNHNITRNNIINELIQRLIGEDNQTMVLNFNYSKIINQYLSNPIINIHGELGSDANPIVFGYAATALDTRNLSNRYYDPLLHNIKQFMYVTPGKKELQKFMNQSKEDLDVIILGHSCGMSDRLILGEIFNHPNVRAILPVYYATRENYRAQVYNIYRLMEEESTFEKLVEFNSCPDFPQLGQQWNEESRNKANYFGLTHRRKHRTGKVTIIN